MAIPDSKLVSLAFRGGINNRSPEAKVPLTSARMLINLDLDADGAVGTRAGRTLTLAGAGIHSMWSTPEIDFALYVQDDELLLYDDTGANAVMRSGLQLREMSYTFVNGQVHYSNGVDTGRVSAMRTASSWGVETPSPSFVVAGAMPGGLTAGEYGVTLTYMSGAEESGAPEPDVCVVSAGGGIALSNIPQPNSPNVTAIRVYVTAPDDPRYFHCRDLAVGMTSVTLGAFSRARLLNTHFMQPAPAGKYLTVKNGRIFSAQGKLLRWTEPVRYGLYNPATNYIALPSVVTGIGHLATEGLHMFIGTMKKTYIYQGSDIDTASLVGAAHVGVVPGSMAMVDAEALHLEGINYRCPVWLGTNGAFFVGTQPGILPLNKSVAATVYGKSAVLLRERGGGVQFIVAGRGGRKPGLGISDRAIARVIEIGN